MKKKSIQAKLSFALDDDDDDNDNDDYNNNKTSSSSSSTMLKSMQAIKKKRKIKQAPNVESINESILLIQTSSSSSSSSYIYGCGGDYSKESLDRLKEAQKFRVINQDSSSSSSSGGVVIEDSTLMDHDDDIVSRNEDGVDSRIHHTTIDHDHHGIDGINSNDNNHMNSAIDGDEILFELSGEEAEAEFIAFTERTSKSSSSNADATDSYDQISSSSAIQSMSYGAYIDQVNTSSSELLDHEAIYQAKLDNKKILNREYIKERLYISPAANNNTATTATTSTINGGRRDIKKLTTATTYDLSIDNDRSWEDEIIKRGVINTNVLVEKHIDIDMDVRDSSINDPMTRKRMLNAGHSNNTSRSRHDDDFDDGKNKKNSSELINTVDILEAVKVGVEKLSSNCDVLNRKIHQLGSDVEISRNKELTFRGMVDKGVKQLNIIQDIKYFFASMVGMLREKQPLIEELYNTVINNSVKEYQALIKNRRIDEQEDRVYRLKQVRVYQYDGPY